MEKKNIFDQFTDKYSLSKTLRFELKPVGKTEDVLRENKVFEKDQTIHDSYNQAKFYFDKLHQRFINSALEEVKIKEISLRDFATFLKEKNSSLLIKRREFNEARKISDRQKIKSLQQGIKVIEGEILEKKKLLSKEIRDLFNKEAENWKERYKGVTLESGEEIEFSKADIKQDGVSFLTSAGVLQILKYEFPESKESEFQKNNWPSLYVEEQENIGEKRYIFDSFDKFSGYLSNFQKTRDNLYDQNLKSSALATRIINNFEIFLANKETFQLKYENNYNEIGFNNIHVFEIDYYRSCLLQKGIDGSEQENDNNSYNRVIGKTNQCIKEYREKLVSDTQKKNGKNFKNDYPFFKKLDKQILGEIEKEKEFIEDMGSREKNNEIFLVRFKEFIKITEDRFSKARKFMTRFFDNEFESSYDNVFIKNTTINTISRRWFAEGYGREFELFLPQKTKNKDEKEEPKVKQFVTLSDVRNAVEYLNGQPFKQSYYDQKIITEGQELWQQFLGIWRHEFNSLFSGIKKKDGAIIIPEYPEVLKEAKELNLFDRSNKKIATVKKYADGSLRIFQLMKYLAIDDRDKDKITGLRDTNFYAELDDYAKDFELIKYYNAFRNFITKKVSDENKIKLNFEKGNLLGGWAESPKGNAQFCAYIFRRGEKYYLGITDEPHILDLAKFPEAQSTDEDSYRKMFYKQLKSQTIYGSMYEKRYNGNKYLKDKKEFSDEELIERIKNLLRGQVCYFPSLKEVIEKDYSNPNSLATEISGMNLYNINFDQQLNNDYIEKIVHNLGDKTKHLYLFEITNKDLSKKSGSIKNIHTLYFKNLFSDLNLTKPNLKLSGGAEIFFRRATKDLPMKKDKKGKKIVSHKRYAEDKIIFHLPIVINLNTGKDGKFNQEINRVISTSNRGPNIIGLDRGEKHLVYYSVINQAGEILDQGSLNKINGVDYHSKLIEREIERLLNRQSWEPISKIKDLKKGYVSQVVHRIADLAIKYDAIVVMEDLNIGFKQARSGIERSVYQQLEKQLIDKFGYLVFKDRDPQDIGGVTKGYQLSAPFKSFEKMGKQTGIIFYTQADYTSITDPLTGFRKNIYIKNSSSQEKIKNVIQKFKKAGWDEKEHSYFFNYDPNDFHDGINFPVPDGGWSVYAKAPRIRREKDRDGYWDYALININEKMEELFKLWDFKDTRAQDMREEISCKELNGELRGKRIFDGKEKNFYESFLYLFNLILQLRNSFSLQIKLKDGKLGSIKEGVDFIASPVKPFFTTKTEKDGEVLLEGNLADFKKMIVSKERDRILAEFNGDANGAYNIARKGIMILKSIKENSEKPDLFISKKQWDEFTQNQWNPTSKSRK